VPLLALFTGVDATAVWLLVGLYLVRVFFITAGYHRLLAHRSFRVGRITQFVFAYGALTCGQKGPLWWTAWHRQHHRYTDTDRDPHSPQHGFWWAHVGWILSGRYGDTHLEVVPDLAKYPELRFLDRHDWIGPWSVGVFAWFVGGWSGLVVGFFGSQLLLWHATFLVNSAAHVFGRRRYDTNDTSRNSLAVALATLGEGWHNNHHHQPTSAREGDRWYEIDPTYGVLRVLSLVGIVHDLRLPKAKALERERVRV